MMTRRGDLQMQFDTPDKAALRALDATFTINDGETATITGEMTVEIVRPGENRFRLTVTFPGGEEFVVNLSRSQTLEQLGVEADKS
jgi:hypothetical protein